MLRFGLFEKRGFDVCINKRDGFEGRNHHMNFIGVDFQAFLYSWRQ